NKGKEMGPVKEETADGTGSSKVARELEETRGTTPEAATAVGGGLLEKRPSGSLAPPPPRHSLNRELVATPAELGAMARRPASFAVAYPLLLARAWINMRRQPGLLLARTMQVVGLGVVLTLFFAPLGNDFYSVQNRVGFVQEVAAFY